MDNLANKRNPLTPSSRVFSDRIRSREYERHRSRLQRGNEFCAHSALNKVQITSSVYKLTNEIEFHEALAKFKDSFKATILGICRTLQREEVNEEI